MACLIITYDVERVGDESARHTRLIAAIQALGAWGRVQSGVWIAQTDVPVAVAFDALMEHLDPEHPLLVAQISGDVKPQWANSLCDSAWLRTRV
ncbi:hypothetical protein SK069_01175 [Patulibacter brassicae]|uniref:Uncharacterized protein n=1 Tax=Patulibacter brassicae TaxID=1705717 RepID=A0ABU4VEH4_9ACTN|nr:hypothetical protein [Patulibacter brassicae]MDX8150192.1 hypothetical protein [Patulibacter brassicae]